MMSLEITPRLFFVFFCVIIHQIYLVKPYSTEYAPLNGTMQISCNISENTKEAYWNFHGSGEQGRLIVGIDIENGNSRLEYWKDGWNKTMKTLNTTKTYIMEINVTRYGDYICFVDKIEENTVKLKESLSPVNFSFNVSLSDGTSPTASIVFGNANNAINATNATNATISCSVTSRPASRFILTHDGVPFGSEVAPDLRKRPDLGEETFEATTTATTPKLKPGRNVLRCDVDHQDYAMLGVTPNFGEIIVDVAREEEGKDGVATSVEVATTTRATMTEEKATTIVETKRKVATTPEEVVTSPDMASMGMVAAQKVASSPEMATTGMATISPTKTEQEIDKTLEANTTLKDLNAKPRGKDNSTPALNSTSESEISASGAAAASAASAAAAASSPNVAAPQPSSRGAGSSGDTAAALSASAALIGGVALAAKFRHRLAEIWRRNFRVGAKYGGEDKEKRKEEEKEKKEREEEKEIREEEEKEKERSKEGKKGEE